MSGTLWPALVAGAKAKASEVESKFDWIEGDLVPMTGGTKTDASYDLGTASFRWRSLYVSNVATFDNYIKVTGASAVAVWVEAAYAGQLEGIYIYNTSNTASSGAYLAISVAGTSAGDPFVAFQIPSGTNWSVGVQNQSSDRFRISQAATLATSPVLDLLGNDSATFYTKDLLVTTTNAGAGAFVEVTNLSGAASSYSAVTLTVAGVSAGDPYIQFLVGGANTYWVTGVDNSDSDKFKISASAYLGTTDVIVATTDGEVTKPLQPAFLAINSSTDSGVLGTATLEFDTEVFDQNADYNNSTDTFTAPITGRYLLSGVVRYSSMTQYANSLFKLRTSNRDYYWDVHQYATQGTMNISVVADMDAADTAYVEVTTAGSPTSGTVNITSGSEFSGCLLA